MCERSLIHWRAAPNFSSLLLAQRKQVLEPMAQGHKGQRCEFRTCSLSRAFFFFFGTSLAACRILVLQPGIEPMPPTVKVQSLNHWITREVPLGEFVQHIQATGDVTFL